VIRQAIEQRGLDPREVLSASQFAVLYPESEEK
jgi:hypothetical protein